MEELKSEVTVRGNSEKMTNNIEGYGEMKSRHTFRIKRGEDYGFRELRERIWRLN